jgi:hypothetical protein
MEDEALSPAQDDWRWRKMPEKEIDVISPVGMQVSEGKGVASRLDTLEGKTVCEVYNHHFKGDYMFHLYRRLLQERYPGVKVIPYTESPTSFVGGDPEYHRKASREIAAFAKEKGCDALISGNGG